jgi:hypothetical protein
MSMTEKLEKNEEHARSEAVLVLGTQPLRSLDHELRLLSESERRQPISSNESSAFAANHRGQGVVVFLMQADVTVGASTLNGGY